ncbi:MAG: YggS family pyridoxal phosphate enzyme [Solirubrobacterales bacterium]|nr:YggS family pyridoxal phosphate enzyme [Solirubrobacterales bacterium]
MVDLIRGLDPAGVRAGLAEVRERVGPGVEIVVATKYLPLEELPALREAGVTTLGESRAQDLQAKHDAQPDLAYEFIGHLQSRKVRQVAPLVRRIHSVGSDSAVTQLARHGRADLELLVEVNIAGEEGKSGVAPGDLDAFLERLRGAGGGEVAGLMTMPPLATNAQDSRRWFAALRELAADRGLRHLSMGTSQDFEVAAQEGATIIRIGGRILSPRG